MNRVDFWDEQAAKGELSGTQDRIAKNLEMQAIAAYVQDGMRVLDVGCGDGETLQWLESKYRINGVGIDFSQNMIDAANAIGLKSNCLFEKWDIKELQSFFKTLISWNVEGFGGSFDLIYTQRCLINLASWEEQRQAILDIASLLKPGGLYLMVENFQDGLDEINAIRQGIGLPAITPPWHNLYIPRINVGQLSVDTNMMLDEKIPFSAAYFFMSRVVNAWLAAQEGKEPDYGAPVNRLGAMLKPELFNVKGQTIMYVWRKI